MVKVLSSVRKLSKAEQGITLVELVIALSLLLLALGLAFQLSYYGYRSWRRTERVNQAQQNARQAASDLIRQLRQIEKPDEGEGASTVIDEADFDRVRFFANIDDDDCWEQVEYVVVGSPPRLERRIYQPPDYVLDETKVIAEDLTNSNNDGRRLFEYFDCPDAGGPIADTDLSEAERNRIRLVKVKPIVNIRGYGEFVVESEVTPRNIGG